MRTTTHDMNADKLRWSTSRHVMMVARPSLPVMARADVDAVHAAKHSSAFANELLGNACRRSGSACGQRWHTSVWMSRPASAYFLNTSL